MKEKVLFRKGLFKKSLQFRLIFLVVIAMATMILLMVINNIYAISIVRRQVYDANSRTLALYMSRIDQAFDNIENYWIGLQQSPELFTIRWRNNETDYHMAQARLKKEMENAIPSYGYVENIFVYFKEHDVYLDAVKYDFEGDMRSDICREVRERAGKEIMEDKRGKWLGVKSGNEYYLMRIFRMGQTYIGGCVRVSSLIDSLRKDGFGEGDYLAFCMDSGQELGNNLPQFQETFDISKGPAYYRSAETNTRYMMISTPSVNGDYNLVTLIRDNSILEGLGSVKQLIAMLVVCVMLFMIFLLVSVKRWMLIPLKDLVDAMRSLGMGNMNVRLQKYEDCEEISMVNSAFNHMIEQIRYLKISVYEEKMNKQKMELQYLKLQVNPHFYINCLNVIHNLSIMKKNDLVQEMTTYLGNHLRYTLEGNSVDFLKKEIAYVENYIRIQELRFDHSIQVHYEVEESVLEAMVPPLIIQTFVENTVKYQMVAGEMLDLYIRIKRLDQGNNRMIMIEIWDSGDGFPDFVLACLNQGQQFFDERGEHYGIHNVQQRLNLIYSGRVNMIFGNHPETGGAFIRIAIPDEKREGGTENDKGSDC